MAQRKYFVDLDLNKNQLKQARLENVAVSGVVSPGTGQVAFDTATNKLAFYNGSTWEVVGQLDVTTVNYRGSVAYDAAEPSPADTGDMYIFSTGGTNGSAWWEGSQTVQAGDFVIYNNNGGADTWSIIQKNVEAASETVAGYVELATNAEANTGSDTTRAITPGNLEYVRQQKTFASVKEFTSQSIGPSGTNIDHNLNTKSVSVSVYDTNDNQVEVQVVTSTVNRVVVTSNTSESGCRVVVVGYKVPA